jgi:2-C-methyl-D-erythritol 4-phosphate cytidylyltransferase/2-C-methyl-D-erythritol 2,4-cyclodiphosphate synthase
MSAACVVVVAAGRGTRLAAPVPKAWINLGGRPLFLHSVTAFARMPGVGRLVLVVDRSLMGAARRELKRDGLGKVVVAPGGKRRQDSVANGVRAVRPRGREVVLVHDCARPFPERQVVAQVAAAASRYGAALAALPAADTVKREGAHGLVAGTVPRAGLWLAQTPQAVRADLVGEWLKALSGPAVTDDVQPLEAAGLKVKLVRGSRRMEKVTYPEDLLTARERVRGETRAGLGFDMHRLVAGRPLVLGGIRIPFSRGLEGHSDADLVCHALSDAILGAICGGDMGTKFGVRRGATRNIASIRFLEWTVEAAGKAGWRVAHADVTLVAEAPRLGRYRPLMVKRLSKALGLSPSDMSLKATTAKKLGPVGKGEAMACFAVVTVAGR